MVPNWFFIFHIENTLKLYSGPTFQSRACSWVSLPKLRIPFSLGAMEKVFFKIWLLCLSESKCPGCVPVFVKESLRWVFGLRLAAAVGGVVPVCPSVRACGLQEFASAPPQSSLVRWYSGHHHESWKGDHRPLQSYILY